ncbi:uncharacterized protein V6R79_013798 [Siganus canaliculatus]
MASARPFHVYTLLDFSLAGFSVLEQHKVQTIERFFSFPSRSAGRNLYKSTKVAAAAALEVASANKTFAMVLRLLLFPQVSQGDATEKLAHQVAAQVAAADRRVEEASGDPHEEEKDEAHKSSKGHVSEPAAECPTSPKSFMDGIRLLDMEDKEKEDLCVGYLPQPRTKIKQPQNSVKPKDEPQRLRPPD